MMQKQLDGLVTSMRFISKLPLKLLQTCATGISVVITKALPVKTPRYAKLNIEIAFPDASPEKIQQIYQSSAINELKSYFEFIHIWGNRTEKNLAMLHSVTGEEYLHEALAAKQGIVLIVPHFGTWEIMNAWVSQFTPMTIMYKPLKNSAVNKFVLQARSREQAHLVPTDETGVKQIFKALKSGGITAILPDHSPDHGGELIDWFGVPLYSSQLSAKMIQKTKARSLLLYALRNENEGFDMFIEPMSEEIYDTSKNGTLLIHKTMEALISRYPEHYHWSYKRFKANPATSALYTLPNGKALALIRQIQMQSSTLGQ
ncbi:MAG: lysophospholipid acyltransferase family protein [Acinetobacter populi]|jgi:KDO2-lipid IV(A) lauroyltransferase|uniref:lysophospholipid acyltransferase family protein n=1 Tax=Acinetobacter populi TaxID=1582270 RepID=UPI002356E677|nr:lysophospholipid acyltransferase family protein [Acinetobacter populi]MCH4246851.1 lysophospholipid acyltransferase family protein [Acinetobacter populi]